jgi:Putative Flp pilus-assembly TadE/G-like
MHPRTLGRFWRGREGEGGQAVVLIAISFLALLMAVGLAIDAGQLFVARRTMQEAADAAAYAGAVVRYQNGSVPAARLAAIADATRNGYTDLVDGFHVEVNAGPSSGLYAGNDKYVEVIIWGSVRTSLVPAQSALTYVRVRGVAGAEPLNNGYAIMALDRGNTPRAFYADNNADIHLNGGGILVNSSSATAAWSDQCNSARFDIQTPWGTDVNGNATGCFPSTGDGLNVTQPQQPDPFAGYPGPFVCTAPCTPATPHYNAMTPVILPGIYDAEVGGAGLTTISLSSGIYILKHGVNASGNADLISLPGGVFIFNTHTNYPDRFRAGIDTCGPLNLSGNATTDLRAMTIPPYANFLVYQDPACTIDMTISGNGNFIGVGTIYVPNAGFVFDGNSASLTGSQLVAKTVTIQSGNITIDFDQGNTAQPIQPRLSE